MCIEILQEVDGLAIAEWHVWVSLNPIEGKPEESPECFIIGSGTTKQDAAMVAIDALQSAERKIRVDLMPGLREAVLKP